MINITGLKKQFGSRPVLKGLDLEIPAGQATGIVGPNGSGKTTLIKLMLGLVKPDEGVLEIDGVRLNGNYNYRHKIGYMPQMARYPENMKVHELASFITKIRGDEPVFKQELIELLGLQPEMEKPLRVLSGGTRQKAGALIALMFDPQILILDEPTAGLDPQSSYRFKQWIKKEKDRGKTILLTTHIMSEIEELADHIILLVEGNIIYHGAQSEIMNQNQEQHLESAVAKIMEQQETKKEVPA